jgi:hypothetical protein
LIVLAIFGEAYKSQSPSLCSLLQPPATVSPLSPNILLGTLFAKTLRSMFFEETYYIQNADCFNLPLNGGAVVLKSLHQFRGSLCSKCTTVTLTALVFWRCRDRISAQRRLPRVFREFPQLLETRTEKLPRKKPWPLLFIILNYPTILCYRNYYVFNRKGVVT